MASTSRGTFVIVLVIASVALFAVTVDGVTSRNPVTSATNGQSCVAVTSDINGELECGSSGEASVLQLSLSPGNVYRFTESMILPSGQTSGDGGACQTADGALDGVNECFVGTEVEYDVEVSQITMRRNLYGRDLEIPYAYAAFHTKSYRKQFGIDQTDLKGRSAFFVPKESDAVVFYPTVRLDNIVTTTLQWDVGELIPFLPFLVPIDILNKLLQIIEAVGSASLQNYILWGEFDFEVVTDDEGNQLFTQKSTRPQACRQIQYADDYFTLNAQRVFFDWPWVTSTARESCGGATCGGNYNCNIDLCCGSFPGQQQIEFTTELNKCPDPSYCKERATHCDMNRIYYSQTKYPEYMNMNGEANEYNYDDDDDNDSCGEGGDDDDESDDNGVCDFSECDELTDKQSYYIAQRYCECPNVDLSGVRPPPPGSLGYLDFSDCEPICFAKNNDDAGEAATDLDINLPSKRGSKCGRFGSKEDAPDDDDDDEQNAFGITNIGDGSKTCSGCDRESRSFCPESCRNVFMQDLLGDLVGTNTPKTPPACRKLRGAAGRIDVVYVSIDDGGLADDGMKNNGMKSANCVSDCLNTPGCNPVDECVNPDRPPLYDDDYEHRLVEGPWRASWVNDVIIGMDSQIFTNHPNAGGRWYNDIDNIRSVPANDESFGSIDDDYFCSTVGMNDQSQDSDSGVTVGTYVAECPPAFCIPNGDHQPDGKYFLAIDDEGDVNPSMVCPNGFFGENFDADTVRERCHRPYPRYPDDYDQIPSESDGTNPDGLHPANPYDYDPKVATVCKLTNDDRVPLIAADQRRFVDTSASYRVAAHSTAEAFALFAPYCHAFYMDAYGSPQFQVSVIRRDLAEINPLDAQNVTVTVYSEEATDGSTVSYYGISDDGTMMVRLRGINGISSAGGVLGAELDDMLVICNGTYDGMAGAPTIPYRMAGATDDPLVATRTPWPTIYQSVSVFWEGFLQTIYGHGGAVFNSNLVALLPISQVLWSAPDAYDTRDYADANDLIENGGGVAGIKKGSAWYTVTRRQQATYGEGYRQIGMKPDFFANDANAERACAAPRYDAVPGTIPGFDWTIQQRNYDSDIDADADFNIRTQQTKGRRSGNQGTWERYLRDRVLTESLPAIVFGRMMEFMSLPTCSQVIAALNEFGHLPNGYLRDAGEAFCDLPTMYPQGSAFYFRDPSVNNDNTIVSVEIVQANSIFTGSVGVVQRAVFVSNPAPICAVGQNSADGQITVSAQNVGQFEADFLVVGDCDSGVVVTSSQSRSLEGQEIGQFTLLLAHSVVGGNGIQNNTFTDFTCRIYITNPGAPDPTTEYFDARTLDDCVLSAVQPGGVTASLPRDGFDSCLDFGTGCNGTPGGGGPLLPGYGSASWALIAFTVLMAILISSCLCVCCGYEFAVKQDSALNVAKIEQAMYKSKQRGL